MKNVITNCYKIKKEKKEREKFRDKRDKNPSRSLDWKWRQNIAKCCSVSLRSWMNQWNCSEVNVQAQGLGQISNYGLWNVVPVWFFLKNCCNCRSKRIEALRSHRYSCRSSSERVCNRSVRTTLTKEPSCVCLIELKTEFNILTWTITSMQLTETRPRRWGKLEFTFLLF